MGTRSADDFKNAAKDKKIEYWEIRTCSICYVRFYHLFVYPHDNVLFWANCDYTQYETPLGFRSWEDIAGFYNMQKSEHVIKEMDEFWGFTKDNMQK